MQPVQGKKEPHSPLQERKPIGLWRDDRCLVIDLQRHEFPPRCVKTNKLVDGPIEHLSFYVQGADWQEVERLRETAEDAELEHRQWDAVIRFNDRHPQGTEVIVQLRLPIAEDWRRHVQSPWPARLNGLGVAFIILFVAWMIGWQRGWIQTAADSKWLWPVIIVCFASSWIWNWRQRRALPVIRMEEGKLWVGGAHRDWLRRLPEFVPTCEFIARRLWEQGPRLWVSLATAAVFLGLVFLAHSMRAETEVGAQVGIAIYLLIAGACILIADHARRRILQLKQQRRRYYPEVDIATFRRKRAQQNA